MATNRKRVRVSSPTQIVRDIEKSIKSTRPKIASRLLIPSGSTMLNLACSDNPFGAYRLGKIITMPGSSSSGKTILMLTCMAEMADNKRFDSYDFIYDDGEEALSFDIKYLFGKLENRLAPPGGYDNENMPVYSNTIQDFKTHILTKCKAKKPFIYVLDSMDALTTDEELEKEYAAALKRMKDPASLKEIKGSYKTEKAKIMGEALRMINGVLKKTDSVLCIVQQIRQKIGVVFGKQTTTSGGNAPFFYSSHQVWLNKSTVIKNKKYDLKIGNSIKAEVIKNKITGKVRDIQFDVYYDYGVDDISSCIDYLCITKTWEKPPKQSYITAPGFGDNDEKHLKKDWVQIIERDNAERDIQKLCGKTWHDIEENIKLSDRKRKY